MVNGNHRPIKMKLCVAEPHPVHLKREVCGSNGKEID